MLRMGMAFVLCAMVGIVGCTSSSSSSGSSGSGESKADSLVGTWEASDPNTKDLTFVMVFTTDGKYSREAVIAGLAKDSRVTVDNGKEEGTFKHEDKTITLTAQGKDKKMTIKELTDSKLVLANAEGKEVTFTKKK